MTGYNILGFLIRRDPLPKNHVYLTLLLGEIIHFLIK